jgi:hypothetical protein
MGEFKMDKDVFTPYDDLENPEAGVARDSSEEQPTPGQLEERVMANFLREFGLKEDKKKKGIEQDTNKPEDVKSVELALLGELKSRVMECIDVVSKNKLNIGIAILIIAGGYLLIHTGVAAQIAASVAESIDSFGRGIAGGGTGGSALGTAYPGLGL